MTGWIRQGMGLVAVVLATAAWGQSSAGWRMDGTGRYPDARPDTQWSPVTNVLWATPMSNWGNVWRMKHD